MFPSRFLKLAKAANLSASKCIAPSLVRCQSTSPAQDLVLVEVNDKTGISTVTLNRPTVNSLNLELLTAISKTLDDLQNNKSRGMILTSSSDKVFSAGLDINEMYKPDPTRMREFWSTLQDVWLKLYGSPFATAAAINGHAPAGGCLLAMSCEYRVMLPKFTIGLNETQLGIMAPSWFMATMKNTVSGRVAESALTAGTLFTTEEALRAGMIDEIGIDKVDALKKCEAFLGKFKKISPVARALTKQQFRAKEIQELELNRAADIDLFVASTNNPKVQQSLGLYIEALKKKK